MPPGFRDIPRLPPTVLQSECQPRQEVCPFSRRSRPADHPAFRPRPATQAPKLVDLLAMTEEEFREEFRGGPVKRAKWRGPVRNVAAALSSSVDPVAKAALVKALDHPEGVVRQQAESSLRLTREQRSV